MLTILGSEDSNELDAVGNGTVFRERPADDVAGMEDLLGRRGAGTDGTHGNLRAVHVAAQVDAAVAGDAHFGGGLAHAGDRDEADRDGAAGADLVDVARLGHGGDQGVVVLEDVVVAGRHDVDRGLDRRFVGRDGGRRVAGSEGDGRGHRNQSGQEADEEELLHGSFPCA